MEDLTHGREVERILPVVLEQNFEFLVRLRAVALVVVRESEELERDSLEILDPVEILVLRKAALKETRNKGYDLIILLDFAEGNLSALAKNLKAFYSMCIEFDEEFCLFCGAGLGLLAEFEYVFYVQELHVLVLIFDRGVEAVLEAREGGVMQAVESWQKEQD